MSTTNGLRNTLRLDVAAELAGLKPQLVRDWVADGLITPALPGRRNRSHRFAPTQAVGLIVAARLRGTDRGCALSYVGRVVAAFAAAPPEWLAEQFAKRRTHLAGLHQGRPLLSAQQYDDWVNVQAAHSAVVAAVAITDATRR